MRGKISAILHTTAGKEIVRFSGLLIVVLIFAVWTNGRILTLANIKSIWGQSMFILIGGVGAVFVIAQGNLNFSLGGVIAVSAMCFGIFGDINPWLAFPMALITSILFELMIVCGHLILDIPPFILSFAVMFLSKGVLSGYTQTKQIVLPKIFRDWNKPNLYYAVTFLTLIIGWFIFEYTKIGKYNKTIGANYMTALASGVKTKKYKILGFLICGITSGIAGSLNIIRSNGVSGSTCSGLETDILIAMVLGGISLSGGTSVKMTGILAGALTLSVLENGMVVAGLSSDIMGVVKGLAFLAAVAIAYERKPQQIIA